MGELKIKKNTLYMVVGVFLALGVFYFFIGTGTSQTNNGISGEGLSGATIPMDPNRQMAGAPCHSMGGQNMGDCETREVEITASQWDWSEPTITVKSGELVKMKATSKDVTHGFSIPVVGLNLRLEPGKTATGEFIAPAPGEYAFGCSVMCGTGHHNHKGKLIVV